MSLAVLEEEKLLNATGADPKEAPTPPVESMGLEKVKEDLKMSEGLCKQYEEFIEFLSSVMGLDIPALMAQCISFKNNPPNLQLLDPMTSPPGELLGQQPLQAPLLSGMQDGLLPPPDQAPDLKQVIVE